MFSDDLIEERKNNPDSEFFYYRFFAEWLWNKITIYGKDHRIRWCMRDNIYEFDIVAGYKHKRTEKYTLYSIEVKTTNFTKAYSQGYMRQCWFDYCYIAFPLRAKLGIGTVLNLFGKNYQGLVDHGLGFLLYDTTEDEVIDVLSAKQKRESRPWPDYKQKMVNKLWDLEIQPKPIVIDHSLADFIPELKAKKEEIKN